MVREAIRLQNLPWEIHIVSDGEQAISFIEQTSNDADASIPDLILLDLNLPRVDGFEILRHLRSNEKYKSIPVLVITSSDSPADRKIAADFGAGFFRKPPNYDDFMKLGGVLKELVKDHKPK